MASPDDPDRARRSGLRLGPMDVPKAADVLANELRERILSGNLAEGASLPPERELVAQTQLSRATVREALRTLEVQGLLTIKAGRAGGAFVNHPDGGSVANSVELVIRSQQIRLAELHETRSAIEPFCAGLAAQRRTAEDLEVLEAANRELIRSADDLPRFLEANIDWHVGVVRASGNDLLLGFMSAISRAIYKATENEQFVDAEVRAIAARAHARVTEAIREGDAEAAIRRMQRHVHGYVDAVRHFEPRDRIHLTEEQTEILTEEQTESLAGSQPGDPEAQTS